MNVALYLAFVGAAFLVVRTYVWQCDRSAGLPVPVPQLPPDPNEIAFLRGGALDVLRATVRSMEARGLLQVDGASVHRGRVSDRLPQNNLEWALFDAASTTKGFRELADVASPVLATLVGPIERRFREERYLMPSGLAARAAVLAALFGLLLTAAATGFAWLALHAGDGPLAAYPCMCVFGLASIVLGARVPRLTDRGRRYLARLDAGAGAVAPAAASNVRAHAAGS